MGSAYLGILSVVLVLNPIDLLEEVADPVYLGADKGQGQGQAESCPCPGLIHHRQNQRPDGQRMPVFTEASSWRCLVHPQVTHGVPHGCLTDAAAAPALPATIRKGLAEKRHREPSLTKSWLKRPAPARLGHACFPGLLKSHRLAGCWAQVSLRSIAKA